VGAAARIEEAKYLPFEGKFFAENVQTASVFHISTKTDSRPAKDFQKTRVFRRHHVLADPVNYFDPSGTGPVSGIACFAALPIAAVTLPPLAGEAAGALYDKIFDNGEAARVSCSVESATNINSTPVKHVGRAAVQAGVSAAVRRGIDRFGPTICIALFVSPNLP